MPTISQEYLELNKQLHNNNPAFGGKGFKVCDMVLKQFVEPYACTRLLDYGAGKGTLGEVLRNKHKLDVTDYDPCYEKFAARPTKKFDGVICNDVLEHIEPEFLDRVLEDIGLFGIAYFFFRISLSPSNKTLPDGRNAHLIIESSDFWRNKLKENGFNIIKELETEATIINPKALNFTCICTKV